MRIAEIFYSVQGEGSLTGVPSVFIRTSGCNLRCRWCDTPYASWQPEWREWTVQEIVAEVLRHPAAHCVLTGGEPMVARDIHELAAALRGAGKHITIETAGTIAPEGIACDLASLSPKLANSVPHSGEIDAAWIARHEETRIRPEILREWIAGYDFQLKFVVSAAGDMAEIEGILSGLNVPPWRVQLMPEGRDAGVLRERQGTLLAICREKGYRFCDRLHIHLFGNTRGT